MFAARARGSPEWALARNAGPPRPPLRNRPRERQHHGTCVPVAQSSRHGEAELAHRPCGPAAFHLAVGIRGLGDHEASTRSEESHPAFGHHRRCGEPPCDHEREGRPETRLAGKVLGAPASHVDAMLQEEPSHSVAKKSASPLRRVEENAPSPPATRTPGSGRAHPLRDPRSRNRSENIPSAAASERACSTCRSTGPGPRKPRARALEDCSQAGVVGYSTLALDRARHRRRRLRSASVRAAPVLRPGAARLAGAAPRPPTRWRHLRSPPRRRARPCGPAATWARGPAPGRSRSPCPRAFA